MPNGPTGFPKITSRELGDLLRALPPDVEVGIRFIPADNNPRSVTASDMLEAVVAQAHAHVSVVEQYGSYYVILLDPPAGAEHRTRIMIGVYASSPLFRSIRNAPHFP